MTMTLFSLGTNDVWSESQLPDYLQAIIAKNRTHFNGLTVDLADFNIGRASER